MSYKWNDRRHTKLYEARKEYKQLDIYLYDLLLKEKNEERKNIIIERSLHLRYYVQFLHIRHARFNDTESDNADEFDKQMTESLKDEQEELHGICENNEHHRIAALNFIYGKDKSTQILRKQLCDHIEKDEKDKNILIEQLAKIDSLIDAYRYDDNKKVNTCIRDQVLKWLHDYETMKIIDLVLEWKYSPKISV